MDQILLLLPMQLRTEKWLGVHIPGLGVLLTLLIVFLTGLLAANIIGQRLVRFWEGVLGAHPGREFHLQRRQAGERYAVLAVRDRPFARRCWSSIRARARGPSRFRPACRAAMSSTISRGEFVSVYVPTTPNPTSGFFLMMPKADVIELDMSVDAALKYIVSMGVVPPAGDGRVVDARQARRQREIQQPAQAANQRD